MLTPDVPPWFVLRGPADGDLVLPAAWDMALTAKQTGLHRARRMHAYVVLHGQHALVDVLAKLAEGARALFYAATPVSTLGTRAAELPLLLSSVAHVLTGRHWLAGDGVAGQLALLGFLPRHWSYTRDLYSRRAGRALKKAYELLCWWRLSDRVHRRRALALKLNAELDADALAELDLDAHALALLRSECLGKMSELSFSVSCTRRVVGLASDEIESGWSKHMHLPMPPPMRNLNVRAMLQDPLSQKGLAVRDRSAPLRLVSTTLVPAEMRLRSWLLRVRDPRDLSYDVWRGSAGPPVLCQVHECAHGACLTRLRAGTASVCAEHLWECRIGSRSAALSAGFCAGCLVPVDGLDTWILSSGHCVCATCAEAEGRELSTPLSSPVSTCISCSRALHRPYKFGLDGQPHCSTCCSTLLSSGGLFEDMVARLVLVWLDLCHSRWPAKFMAAGQLFCRKLGRQLASACVQRLHRHNMPAADALRPVALRRVIPPLAAITLRWLHDDGERTLLRCDFGVWAQSLLVSGEAFSYNDFTAVDACPLPPPAPLSLAGAGFLAGSVPSEHTARPAGMQEFLFCSHNFEVLTPSVSNEDDGGFAPVAPANDQLVCGLCNDCTMDAHEDAEGRQISGLAVHICEGCQGGYHSHCVRDELVAGTVSAVSWSDLSLVERRSTWRCGDCVEADRWGVRSLVESMLTFGTAQCSAKSATYSVLTHFHADTTLPEACFLHGHVPPGADPHGNIKDESLVDDLRRRQRLRLAEGGDPHSKLPRLLELAPMTGKFWYRPDMTAEHHAATVRDWVKRAPSSFRAQTAVRGRAGSRATFDTKLTHARQQWLFVEPCMREPLMITPLNSEEHPHFKRPPPQGWS